LRCNIVLGLARDYLLGALQATHHRLLVWNLQAFFNGMLFGRSGFFGGSLCIHGLLFAVRPWGVLGLHFSTRRPGNGLLWVRLCRSAGRIVLRYGWFPKLPQKKTSHSDDTNGSLEKIGDCFVSFRSSLCGLDTFKACFFLGGSDFLRRTLLPFGEIGPAVVCCSSDTQKVENYVNRISNK